MKEKQIIKGFKGSWRGECRGLQYEVGKTYSMRCRPQICARGYHFCENVDDVFEYYPYDEMLTMFEVEALGMTFSSGNKSVTNKIRIVREIPFEEYSKLLKRYKFNKQRLVTYKEEVNGEWRKYRYNQQGVMTRLVRSDGYWKTYKFRKGECVELIDSYGAHVKYKDGKPIKV